MKPSDIRAACDRLRTARRVVVSSGAGMSAESGVPTFRGADGMWSRFNPDELATPMAFARDPERVWEWYRARRIALASCEPHDGHRVLANWERRFELFDIITQNVDGLHHRAGSSRVIELHGRLDVVRCTGCAAQIVGLDDLGPAPHCDRCGAWLRPGVVWFHEPLPADALDRAEQAVSSCDLLLSIGTSGLVYPAAGLLDVALRRDVPVIEINPDVTPFTECCWLSLRAGAREALVALARGLK